MIHFCIHLFPLDFLNPEGLNAVGRIRHGTFWERDVEVAIRIHFKLCFHSNWGIIAQGCIIRDWIVLLISRVSLNISAILFFQQTLYTNLLFCDRV